MAVWACAWGIPRHHRPATRARLCSDSASSRVVAFRPSCIRTCRALGPCQNLLLKRLHAILPPGSTASSSGGTTCKRSADPCRSSAGARNSVVFDLGPSSSPWRRVTRPGCSAWVNGYPPPTSGLIAGPAKVMCRGAIPQTKPAGGAAGEGGSVQTGREAPEADGRPRRGDQPAQGPRGGPPRGGSGSRPRSRVAAGPGAGEGGGSRSRSTLRPWP